MRLTSVLLLLMTCDLTGQTAQCPRACVCDVTRLTVTCVGKNLTHVPPAINEITVKLDLKRNNLGELLKGAFKHTPYLTHLSLQGCGLRAVREGAFRGLPRLLQLDLTHNSIDIIYQESFDGLSSLKQLYLDRNRIEEIHPGAFASLSSINLLSLTHNQLTYLPNMAFQGLLNIRSLRLSHNLLNNVAAEAFAGLLTLTHLSLDHNELQFFPTKTMSRLQELTHLDMSFNRMTSLVDESVMMPKLTHLSLSHMTLRDLSESAVSLSPFLSHLDLSYNQLPYIQPLTGTTRITSLNLTGNPIRCTCLLQGLKRWSQSSAVRLSGVCVWPPHLSDEPLERVQQQHLRCRPQDEMMPEEMEKEGENDGEEMKNKSKKSVRCPKNCLCESDAQHATCEERGLTKVPTGFPGNTLLLDLRGNHFHYLPSNSFPGVPKVVSLHLDGCKIHELEGGAFRGMTGLMYLYLSDNQLSSLDTNAFAGAGEILYLHLEGNRLSRFPSAATLAHIPKLIEVHLERNLIAKLEPAGLLTPVPQLTGLYLTSNTITTTVPEALHPAPKLDILHLGANKLTEVPGDALGHAPALTELRLSGNPIRWIGPRAFRGVATSLKHLYINRMGLQKMSGRSLAGFGSGLLSLSLEENQLEELPDLSPLTGLQNISLNNNPLMCDCRLLPLYRWLVNAAVDSGAVCGYPAELRAQLVTAAVVFKNCSAENTTTHSFSETSVLNKPRQSLNKTRPDQTEPDAETRLTTGPVKDRKKKKLHKPVKSLKTTSNKKNRRKKSKIREMMSL